MKDENLGQEGARSGMNIGGASDSPDSNETKKKLERDLASRKLAQISRDMEEIKGKLSRATTIEEITALTKQADGYRTQAIALTSANGPASNMNISWLDDKYRSISSAVSNKIATQNSQPSDGANVLSQDQQNEMKEAEEKKHKEHHESKSKIKDSHEKLDSHFSGFDALSERRSKKGSWDSDKANNMASTDPVAFHNQLVDVTADMHLRKALMDDSKEQLRLQELELLKMAKSLGFPQENSLQQIKADVSKMTDKELEQKPELKNFKADLGLHDEKSRKCVKNEEKYQAVEKELKILNDSNAKSNGKNVTKEELASKVNEIAEETGLAKKLTEKALQEVSLQQKDLLVYNNKSKEVLAEEMALCSSVANKCGIDISKNNTPEKFFAELSKKVASEPKLMDNKEISLIHSVLKEEYHESLKQDISLKRASNSNTAREASEVTPNLKDKLITKAYHKPEATTKEEPNKPDVTPSLALKNDKMGIAK
jgi:hypothetical protein